jgi:hypothetical protein
LLVIAVKCSFFANCPTLHGDFFQALFAPNGSIILQVFVKEKQRDTAKGKKAGGKGRRGQGACPLPVYLPRNP